MSKSVAVVDLDGSITTIYNDELIELLEEGEATITRASDVEPNPDGSWSAIMRDRNIVLGPFKLRQEALDAEVKYLQNKLYD